jgi:DNA topoisomerase-3
MTFEKPVCNITEHFTKPKSQFTEDTLLSAMNNAGVDEITEDVERSGLGTPATRASIIEKLIKSGFIKRNKKNIVVTNEGAELVSLMPEAVKSASLTAEWENTLSLIAKGEYSPDKFMEHIENLVKEIVSSAQANVNPDKVVKRENKGDVIGSCPRCKADVCETPKAYSCACGFTLWKNNKFFESAKKPFTKEIATALIKNGRTAVDGLYSPKTGKTYNAVVCLDDTGKYINFKLEFPPRKRR